MARVRDTRTTRAGAHAEVEHQACAGTARGSVCVYYGSTGTADAKSRTGHACGDAQTTQQCHAQSCTR
eukprot:7212932-Prymnesium_polylepis.1